MKQIFLLVDADIPGPPLRLGANLGAGSAGGPAPGWYLYIDRPP